MLDDKLDTTLLETADKLDTSLLEAVDKLDSDIVAFAKANWALVTLAKADEVMILALLTTKLIVDTAELLAELIPAEAELEAACSC